MAGAAKQANFTLPEELLEGSRRTVPKGEQSRRCRQALRNELKRIEFRNAIEKSFGAWKANKHPELAQGSRRFVRPLRRSTRLQRMTSR
jgi:homogentisate 1,2-dioxygenase